MKLVMILLAMQTVVAFTLTFRSISFNIWESNEGIRNREDWLSLVTGGVFLTGAGLGWYGYLQHDGWCWGFTGLRLLKLCVDAVGFVLLYFLFAHIKSTASALDVPMHLLRRILCWNFALLAVVCLSLAIWLTAGVIQRHGTTLPISVWLLNGVAPAEATAFAVAWWFIWKRKPSGRVLGIAASLILILNAVWFYVRTSRPQLVLLVVGIAGVVAFFRRDSEMTAPSLDN